MNTLPPEIQYEIAILLDVGAVRALIKSRVLHQEALDAVATKVGKDLMKSVRGKVFTCTRQKSSSLYIVKSIDIKNDTLVIKKCLGYDGPEFNTSLVSFNLNTIVFSECGKEDVLKYFGIVHTSAVSYMDSSNPTFFSLGLPTCTQLPV